MNIITDLQEFPDVRPGQKLYVYNNTFHVDNSIIPVRTVLSKLMVGYCRKDVISKITQLSTETFEYVKNHIYKNVMCVYKIKSYKVYNIVSAKNDQLLQQCDTVILEILRILQSLTNMGVTYQYDEYTLTTLQEAKSQFMSVLSLLSHIRHQYKKDAS